MKLRRTFLAKSPWVFVAAVFACTTKPPAPRAPEPSRHQPPATVAANAAEPARPDSSSRSAQTPKPEAPREFDPNSEQGKKIVTTLDAFLEELRTKGLSKTSKHLEPAYAATLDEKMLKNSFGYLFLPDPPKGSKDFIPRTVRFSERRPQFSPGGVAFTIAMEDGDVTYGRLAVYFRSEKEPPEIFQVDVHAPNGVRIDTDWIAEQKKPLDPEKVPVGRSIGAFPDLTWQVPAIVAGIERHSLFPGIFSKGRREDLARLLWCLSMYISQVKITVPTTALKRLSRDKRFLQLVNLALQLWNVMARAGDLPQKLADPIRAYLKGHSSKSVQLSAISLWLNRDNADHIRAVYAVKRGATLNPSLDGFWRTELGALDWLSKNTTLVPELQARLAELKAEASVVKVTADDLLTEYKANEVRADTQYKGKTVEVTGVVGAVRDTMLGGISVDIGVGKRWEFQFVSCFVTRDQAKTVSELNKGDRVRVRGRVAGLVMNVRVEDCRIVGTGS